MTNFTDFAKPEVIYEHVRGWVCYKGKPNRSNYFTIVGCMAGALIDYHGTSVVHIGASARNLDDEVDKAIGREIALKRALDISSTYKIHISNCGVSRSLWELSIKDFAIRCFKHFHKPVLFPKGMIYTRFPDRWDKKQAKEAIKVTENESIGD